MNCSSQDPGYLRLKDHLIASTGLAFYSNRDDLLGELIGARLSYLGLHDCHSYVRHLADGEQGKAEMNALIAHLTIGETYFFRDEEQFAAIRDIVFPDILRRNHFSRQLRIWSAGCATGAEPYSLAILLARKLSDRRDGWQVRIHATDLNQSFLNQAAEGKFRAAALRSTSEDVKQECFSKEGLVWSIHPQYKQWITFHQMNLMEDEFSPLSPEGAGFDLILCRNVMIYFSRDVNRRLLGQFHHALGDGGWLVVGAPEYGLDNFRAFRTVNANGVKLFQKMTLPIGPREVAWEPPPPLVATSKGSTGLEVKLPVEPNPMDIDGLRLLADRGHWRSAAEYGRRLLAQDGTNAQVHLYLALIFEKLGIAGEPTRSLRKAIYLDRNFALAHYYLGVALRRERQDGAAARSFANVLTVLAGLPDLATIASGAEVTVTGLKKLARMHLESVGGG